MDKTNSFEMNVVTQNVLLDKTLTTNGRILPQELRVTEIADALQTVDGSLDLVSLQEVHAEDYHNGETIAELCGYGPGFWVGHNEKPYPESKTGRKGEYVGMFGNLVESVRSVELGDNRRAVITIIGGVAFMMVHFRAGYTPAARALRKDQSARALDILDDFDDAVLLGDLNEPDVPLIAAARGAIKDAGFTSAFTLTNQQVPKTFPTKAYGPLRKNQPRWSPDDILVRGERVEVLSAGVLSRTIEAHTLVDCNGVSVPALGSDHDGLYVRLRITTQ